MIQTLFRLRRGPSTPPTIKRLSASLNSTKSASIQWSVQRDTEGQQHRVSAGPTARLPGRSDRPSMVTTRPSVQPRQVVDCMASRPQCDHGIDSDDTAQFSTGYQQSGSANLSHRLCTLRQQRSPGDSADSIGISRPAITAVQPWLKRPNLAFDSHESQRVLNSMARRSAVGRLVCPSGVARLSLGRDRHDSQLLARRCTRREFRSASDDNTQCSAWHTPAGTAQSAQQRHAGGRSCQRRQLPNSSTPIEPGRHCICSLICFAEGGVWLPPVND